MKKQDIPTPALVVDYDKLCHNINEMADRARRAGKKLRPHAKTHKTPIIAQMQVKAGAAGIACAKLGEAEVYAQAGIEDIFVAYPIVGPDKVERLLDLAAWVPRISTSIDTLPAARALSQAAVARGQRIDVIVEVDAGYNRCGVQPGQPLLAFVREVVANMPGLHYKGLMFLAPGVFVSANREEQCEGEKAGARIATDAAAMLARHGIASEVISGGTTPGSQFMDQIEGVTEFRPGCYVFGDMKYADYGALTRDQMALTILTTVVSAPDTADPDHFVVDAGSKTLTHAGAYTTPGYGTFVQCPELHVTVPSEEHGGVRLPPGHPAPAVGTKLDIWPNYVSDVVNLADRLWVVKNDQVIAAWDILARGKRV